MCKLMYTEAFHKENMDEKDGAEQHPDRVENKTKKEKEMNVERLVLFMAHVVN